MAIEINGKVYRTPLEQIKKNKDDIEELQGQGYTAGTGIDITNNEISVDEDVAMKTDLDYNNLSNKPDLTVYAKLNDDTQNITANTVTVTPGAGYIHTTYDATTIHMSIPRTPGYTLNIPTKDGTLATTGDIPTYTGGSGISISGTTISADSTLARVADITFYRHQYQCQYSSADCDVKFYIQFVTKTSTAFATPAALMTYILANYDNGEIVGTVFGTRNVPSDLGIDVKLDTVDGALELIDEGNTSYIIYAADMTFIKAVCKQIN